MVIGRNNRVVGLTGFSDKKMSGLLCEPQKSGRNNGVVVLTGWSYGGVPLYVFLNLNRPLNHEVFLVFSGPFTDQNDRFPNPFIYLN